MIPTPPLIRSIGEHYWEEGKCILEEQDTNFICIQTFYGTGDLQWNFYVSKDNGIFYKETYKKNTNEDTWLLCNKVPFPL